MRLPQVLKSTDTGIVSIIVTAESDLCIASGAGGHAWTDRAVLRDAMGIPYIPGSHLKGITRAYAEMLASLADGIVCNAPRPESMCPLPGRDDLCAVCMVFGNPRLPAKVVFADLRSDLINELASGLTLVRNGVSIDRFRRTATEGRLFTTEVVPAGARFTGTVELDPALSSEQKKLVVRALRMVERIGGNKSVGLGRVRVEISEAR